MSLRSGVTFTKVIANPPYGSQGGNLARKIINKLQPLAQRTLIYFILDLLCEAYNGGAFYQEICVRVDWSRSWTDAEILKELELPEDFLNNF